MRVEEAARIYGAARVNTATPLDIFILLAERAIKDLEGAARALETGKPDVAMGLSRHARDVLFELMSGLDRHRGGKVAESLAALYAFILTRLKPDAPAATLRSNASLLAPILDAYRSIRVRS